MRLIKSYLFFFILPAFMLACSPKQKMASTLELQSAFLNLKQRYPIIATSSSNHYLSLVSKRLGDSLPKDNKRLAPEIIIVRTKTPLAVAGPTGEILLSTKFLKTLGTESELMFVLSHELAHSALKHARQSTRTSAAEEQEFRHQAELEADAYAVSVMVVAGYDPRHATKALAFVYRLQGIEPDIETHPEFAERVYAIESAITETGWIPPGIATSRSFKKFQKSI